MGNNNSRNKELTHAQKLLLNKRINQYSNRQDLDNVIMKRNYNEVLPLSFSQERIWLVQQMSAKKYAYNVPGAIMLNGVLNERVLEKSINKIIERHESLRTVIKSDNSGQAVQVITPFKYFTLNVIDLQELSCVKQEEKISSISNSMSKQEFDIEEGPLIRISLVKKKEREHILFLTIHHLVFDGWSMEVFLKELSNCYKAYLDNSIPELKELLIQYKDFAFWQRKQLHNENLNEMITYWKEHLKDVTPRINLPYKGKRQPVQTFNGKTLYSSIPKSIKNDLEMLCKENGVTMYMVLLAAFNVLLHKYTGKEKVVIGTPIANRHRREVEPLIGLIMNVLPIYTDISNNPTVTELLKRVKSTALNAFSRQDLPFEKIVENLSLERDLSSHPLFQVMFQLQNDAMIQLPDLDMKIKELDNGSSKLDLTVRINQISDSFEIYWEYNIDLFDETTMKKMLEQFKHLLNQIVKKPNSHISSLKILVNEDQKLINQTNDTLKDYPKETYLHELFEKNTSINPNQVAIIYENIEITYEELNKRANKLANYLIKQGIKSNRLVGIIMERSIEMVISLLAIVKAGGAYVPIDPQSPGKRIKEILENAEPDIVLTQSFINLPNMEKQTICVDINSRMWEKELDENPHSIKQPEDLMYVIYTSGTTGKPKGVMNTCKGVFNRIYWMQESYKLTKRDRVLQKTPFTFDVSVWEFFWPLIAGSTIVVASPEGHKDPKYLGKLIKENNVTTMHFVPSMLRIFLDANQFSLSNSLKRVFCSGEALLYQDVLSFYKQSNARLYNLYGPTEAAIDVTSWECHLDEMDLKTEKNGIVPIGKPVSNTQIYILDKYLNQVPIGVVGELFIGGVQVALGYLNQAELTKEKFIPNPFEDKCSKLYRTGDLARYQENGNIEFLGRADDQIKIRGLRVELGEIQLALSNYSKIKQSVITVYDTNEIDRRIIAYYISHSKKLNSLELREYLQERIPEFMIPSKFICVDSFPLTSSGKVDKKKLPQPDMSNHESSSNFIPTSTNLENVLANIWSEVLNLNSIGKRDNFFEIGGHSLLATQVVSRIEKTFHIDFPLIEFFGNPTIEGISNSLLKDKTISSRVEKIAEIVIKIHSVSEEEAEGIIRNRVGSMKEVGE